MIMEIIMTLRSLLFLSLLLTPIDLKKLLKAHLFQSHSILTFVSAPGQFVSRALQIPICIGICIIHVKKFSFMLKTCQILHPLDTSVPAPALAIGRSESPGLLFGTVSPLNSANLIVLDSSAER